MSDVTLPLAEIKKRLSEIVDGVEREHNRVVLPATAARPR